jgi:hypothetical protein
MYNLYLLMMGLWGLKHVEERGKPDTVYRRKRIVYQVGNKDKIYLLFWMSYVDIEKQMAGFMYSLHTVLFHVTHFEITSNSIIKQERWQTALFPTLSYIHINSFLSQVDLYLLLSTYLTTLFQLRIYINVQEAYRKLRKLLFPVLYKLYWLPKGCEAGSKSRPNALYWLAADARNSQYFSTSFLDS